MESAEFACLPAAGAGIVIRLALHAWFTAPRGLPTSENELRSISRAHKPTWAMHKAGVLKVIAEWWPSALAYWHERENKLTTIKFAARNGAATTNATRRAKAIEVSLPASETPHGPLIPSQSPDRYRSPLPAKPDSKLIT